MKKWVICLFIIGFCYNAYGADTKVSDLGAIAGPVVADEMYIVDGGAASKKITVGNLFAVANDLDAAGDVIDDSHNHVFGNIDATASANWATRVNDETGTGLWVFSINPTFDGLISSGEVTAVTVTGVSVTGASVYATTYYGGNVTDWDTAYTHVSSDGTDHGYIDQDVTTTGTPTFGAMTSSGEVTAITVTGISVTGVSVYATTYYGGNVANWDTTYGYVDQDVTIGSSPTLDATNITGYTETDTLDDVVGRGATTTDVLEIGGLGTTGTVSATTVTGVSVTGVSVTGTYVHFGVGYTLPSDVPTDNYIVKFDAAKNRLGWEADAGGAGVDNTLDDLEGYTTTKVLEVGGLGTDGTVSATTVTGISVTGVSVTGTYVHFGIGYRLPTDVPADNYIIKYDDATKRLDWEADAGTGVDNTLDDLKGYTTAEVLQVGGLGTNGTISGTTVTGITISGNSVTGTTVWCSPYLYSETQVIDAGSDYFLTDGGITASTITANTIINGVVGNEFVDYSTIQFTITEPDSLAEGTYLPVWSNYSGKTFNVVEVHGWVDFDPYNVVIGRLVNETFDGILCDFFVDTDGANITHNSVTTVSLSTITNETVLYFDAQPFYAPDVIKITIMGYYD